MQFASAYLQGKAGVTSCGNWGLEAVIELRSSWNAETKSTPCSSWFYIQVPTASIVFYSTHEPMEYIVSSHQLIIVVANLLFCTIVVAWVMQLQTAVAVVICVGNWYRQGTRWAHLIRVRDGSTSTETAHPSITLSQLHLHYQKNACQSLGTITGLCRRDWTAIWTYSSVLSRNKRRSRNPTEPSGLLVLVRVPVRCNETSKDSADENINCIINIIFLHIYKQKH